MTVDTEGGVYKFTNEFIVNANYIDHLHYSGWFESGSTIAITGESEEPTTAPAGLETKDAFMAGYLNTGSAKVTLQNVKIGKVDNDIYIQGWRKTTRNTILLVQHQVKMLLPCNSAIRLPRRVRPSWS